MHPGILSPGRRAQLAFAFPSTTGIFPGRPTTPELRGPAAQSTSHAGTAAGKRAHAGEGRAFASAAGFRDAPAREVGACPPPGLLPGNTALPTCGAKANSGVHETGGPPSARDQKDESGGAVRCSAAQRGSPRESTHLHLRADKVRAAWLWACTGSSFRRARVGHFLSGLNRSLGRAAGTLSREGDKFLTRENGRTDVFCRLRGRLLRVHTVFSISLSYRCWAIQ